MYTLSAPTLAASRYSVLVNPQIYDPYRIGLLDRAGGLEPMRRHGRICNIDETAAEAMRAQRPILEAGTTCGHATWKTAHGTRSPGAEHCCSGGRYRTLHIIPRSQERKRKQELNSFIGHLFVNLLFDTTASGRNANLTKPQTQ